MISARPLRRRTAVNPSSVLQSGVAVGLVVRRAFGGHTEVLTGPGAKVDVFAALAAKRTEGIGLRIQAASAAVGAFHDLGGVAERL